jgi:hypothetical protein
MRIGPLFAGAVLPQKSQAEQKGGKNCCIATTVGEIRLFEPKIEAMRPCCILVTSGGTAILPAIYPAARPGGFDFRGVLNATCD